MNSCPNVSELHALVGQRLTYLEVLKIDQHLAECPKCQRVLDEVTLYAERYPADNFDSVPSKTDLANPLADARDSQLKALQRIKKKGPSVAQNPHHFETKPVAVSETLGKSSSEPVHVIPKSIGGYKIIRRLAEGGMGRVYLAQDSKLGRKVAIKVPHRWSEDDEIVVSRFIREARALATIQHPNICSIHEVAMEDHVPFMVMSYIQGQTLAQILENGRPLKTQLAVQLVCKIASALSLAHQAGIIHRDLTCSNIMINEQNEPILMDFGLAKRQRISDENITVAGQVMGSPRYMSPEQISGNVDEMGPACDIYGLGVVLYEMLTGKSLFETDDILKLIKKIALENPTQPNKINPKVDPALSQICMTCLQKDPEDRYASMDQLIQELENYPNSQLNQPGRDISSLKVRNEKHLIRHNKSIKQNTSHRTLLISSVAVASIVVILGIGIWLANIPKENPREEKQTAKIDPQSVKQTSPTGKLTQKELSIPTNSVNDSKADFDEGGDPGEGDDDQEDSDEDDLESDRENAGDEAEALLDEYDDDGDSELSMQELVQVLMEEEEEPEDQAKEFAKEEMELYDKNEDSLLSREEIVTRILDSYED